MRNSNSKRIKDGGCKSDVGCKIAHPDTNKGVVAHADGKLHKNQCKCQCFFTHAENGSKSTENNHYERYDNIVNTNKPDKFPFLETLGKYKER